MTEVTGKRKLMPPALEWLEGTVPYSGAFGDVYYSRKGGLAESQFTFLDGNRLGERWSCPEFDGEDTDWRRRGVFQIGETGFGTGLNLLTAWHLFERTAPAACRLSYLSFEAFPLRAQDIARALAPWPALSDHAARFLACYPPCEEGFHRVHLTSRVMLTLVFGDAATMMPNVHAGVDAWFLDGFAPRTNPDLWTPGILAEIARLSVVGTSFATFTAAGEVRRGLGAVGFEVSKQPGFGGKRERLVGTFRAKTVAESPAGCGRSAIGDKPWFAWTGRRGTGGRSAVVIGSGIAGATVAHSLRRRGWEVRIFETGSAFASGASSNPAPLIKPKLMLGNTPVRQFYLDAYLYAIRFLQDPLYEDCWHRTPTPGIAELATTAEEESKKYELSRLGLLRDADCRFVTRAEASDLTGLEVRFGGLYFPRAGSLQGRVLCRRLMGDIPIETGRAISRLERCGELWLVIDTHGNCLARTPHVVVANGAGIGDLTIADDGGHHVEWDLGKRLETSHGDLFRIVQGQDRPTLRCVVSSGKHFVPCEDDTVIAGSTFRKTSVPDGDVPAAGMQADRAIKTVLARLYGGDPGNATALEILWSGVRCSTPDRLPIAGGCPHFGFFARSYQDLAKGRRDKEYRVAEYLPGLFVHGGLGARGFTTAFLCSELIASQMAGEVLPVAGIVADTVHPARFLIRDLRRGKHAPIVEEARVEGAGDLF